MIRTGAPEDAFSISRLYNHYVLNTTVTFETDEVSSGEMASRIHEVTAAGLPWVIAELDGRLVGYAYASKWKGRCAYRYSVESTVYVDAEHTGKGIGTELYGALLARLRSGKTHVVIGGIALPNEGSVALHEHFGFRKVAHFNEVGFKFERWIDVGYWQTTL
ncbi:phosphinothricin acetyltransferase [Trinickia symbiotica]|uniref:Phosphinothricin acetyltransferase n=1 Tax=Trinickia symbiotica TaxID=863227 RepID=A0A2N7WZH9_9BURK|nr:arsinothricin resistance N-acetyltransferase ArsN1 family B [Trinickia symbiotica]PMS34731.1 phosphinothricin acetyltransferase [Trinickia symbiotica]PPK43299.1 phosphinothricin acetyltransferase [Trinickia symbiotica]